MKSWLFLNYLSLMSVCLSVHLSVRNPGDEKLPKKLKYVIKACTCKPMEFPINYSLVSHFGWSMLHNYDSPSSPTLYQWVWSWPCFLQNWLSRNVSVVFHICKVYLGDETYSCKHYTCPVVLAFQSHPALIIITPLRVINVVFVSFSRYWYNTW